ncbi:MAG: D-alanyl-D-alanine carboxypeptidase/D-alanyl-D-alanine-endopeptidase [Gemmatimonadota bacterium]|nr:D-alanyl-D-alanine carboxypeptidase/D-alanyl-D-alanine-endopeptidase [Gemmatimonadota bacterium]
MKPIPPRLSRIPCALALLALAGSLACATGRADRTRATPPNAPSRVEAAEPRLPEWIDRFADGALERAHWGVAVYDLTADRWVARHAAGRFFVPASNLKLIVTAVGLERLGPDYRWTTSVYGTAPVGEDGTLAGDLVLYGRGDPNLSGRFADSMTAIFDSLAVGLAERGVRRVTGDLLADESLWDADHVRGDWANYDLLWWYAAPVAALGFNDNAIDFRIEPGEAVGEPPVIESEPESAFYSLENRATTGPPGSQRTFDFGRVPGTNRVFAYGSVPLDADPFTEWFSIVDPAGWAATVFAETLETHGIEVAGDVVTIADPTRSPVAAGDTIALAEWRSVPLVEVVGSINGRSQNLHAEMLLKTIGREERGEGSWTAGLAVERATLAELGVDTTAFLLRDASGLASANLATPEALVGLLRAARDRPWGEAYAASLPVAAERGSLRRRFANTAGAGRVRAKTGYIENVHALSGYLTTLDGHERAFSVIVNQTGGESATDAIDALVSAIVAGSAFEDPAPEARSVSSTPSPSSSTTP